MQRDTKIAWAAGLLEGEGSFLFRGKEAINIQCSMTDYDVLAKLQTYFGGSLYSITKRQEHWKDAWIWVIRGNSACELITEMLPHMGSRRTEKMKRLKDRWEKYTAQQKAQTDNVALAVKYYSEMQKPSLRLAAEQFNISRMAISRAIHKNMES